MEIHWSTCVRTLCVHMFLYSQSVAAVTSSDQRQNDKRLIVELGAFGVYSCLQLLQRPSLFIDVSGPSVAERLFRGV